MESDTSLLLLLLCLCGCQFCAQLRERLWGNDSPGEEHAPGPADRFRQPECPGVLQQDNHCRRVGRNRLGKPVDVLGGQQANKIFHHAPMTIRNPAACAELHPYRCAPFLRKRRSPAPRIQSQPAPNFHETHDVFPAQHAHQASILYDGHLIHIPRSFLTGQHASFFPIPCSWCSVSKALSHGVLSCVVAR